MGAVQKPVDASGAAGAGMLVSLDIRDILIIDRLDLQFQPGLNVLTGETVSATDGRLKISEVLKSFPVALLVAG